MYLFVIKGHLVLCTIGQEVVWSQSFNQLLNQYNEVIRKLLVVCRNDYAKFDERSIFILWLILWWNVIESKVECLYSSSSSLLLSDAQNNTRSDWAPKYTQ